MKTKFQPTEKQDSAANAVRNYLRQRGGIESDERDEEKQCFRITTSYRDGAGDDEPSERIRKEVATHVKALRELSPLVYVSTEEVDEWINLSVRVKNEPRKDRPELVKDLAKIILDRLPESVSKHPKSRFIGSDYSRDFCGMLTVLTDVMGSYGKLSVRLGWQLDGDTTNGWKLRVQWGDHKIIRPARFKKLTPAIVLEQFDKILARLSDPLDAMGWTIHARKDGNYIMNLSGRVPEKLALFQVLDDKKQTIRINRGDTAEFNNNYDKRRISVVVGEPLPGEVLPILIEE